METFSLSRFSLLFHSIYLCLTSHALLRKEKEKEGGETDRKDRKGKETAKVAVGVEEIQLGRKGDVQSLCIFS